MQKNIKVDADAPGNFRMDGKLRNMTSLYIQHEDQFLLLYRQGSRIADGKQLIFTQLPEF